MPGRDRSGAGLHASLDSFYRTARDRRQDRSGVTLIPLRLLPRRCPFCGNESIIGHGRRKKQAHDQHRDWIWVRRGRCPPCQGSLPATAAIVSVRRRPDRQNRKCLLGSPTAKAGLTTNRAAPYERHGSPSLREEGGG